MTRKDEVEKGFLYDCMLCDSKTVL